MPAVILNMNGRNGQGGDDSDVDGDSVSMATSQPSLYTYPVLLNPLL